MVPKKGETPSNTEETRRCTVSRVSCEVKRVSLDKNRIQVGKRIPTTGSRSSVFLVVIRQSGSRELSPAWPRFACEKSGSGENLCTAYGTRGASKLFDRGR